MDVVYLMVVVIFFALTWGMVSLLGQLLEAT
jgi:hypothetical protein